MMKVARPTTITEKRADRLILMLGLVLIIGVPLFVGLYWLDRHVSGSPSIAEQAIAAGEAAVQKNPNSLATRNSLAAAYVSAGRTQDGIDQFTAALAIDPKSRPALLGRAIAYIKLNQPDAAIADMQKFVADNSSGEFAKQDPQLEQAYYELGVAQLMKGDATGAVDSLKKAVAINASDADALYSLGQALNKTGKNTDALTVLTLAVQFVPTGWCEPYQELATTYSALKMSDGAAWANAMDAFCEGNLDTAQAALQPLTSGQMKLQALLGLGYVAAARGDKPGAVQYFTEALADDPGNVSATIALNGLGAKSSSAPSPAGAGTSETAPSPTASN